jgi:hypothetical protein
MSKRFKEDDRKMGREAAGQNRLHGELLEKQRHHRGLSHEYVFSKLGGSNHL